MSSSAVLSTRRETHPHHPLPSKPNAVNNCTFHPKRGPPTPPPAFGTKRGPQLYFPPEARSTPTIPCFRYETRSITVLSTRSEVHPHHPLLSVQNEDHNCTFHPKRELSPPPPAFGT